MLGIGQPFDLVAAFSDRKSMQNRHDPFGLGVSNI